MQQGQKSGIVPSGQPKLHAVDRGFRAPLRHIKPAGQIEVQIAVRYPMQVEIDCALAPADVLMGSAVDDDLTGSTNVRGLFMRASGASCNVIGYNGIVLFHHSEGYG